MSRFYTHYFRYLLFFLLGLIGLLLVSSSIHAQGGSAGIYKTINFQGKVVNTNGTNVTDGTYSFVFKIYDVSSAGSALWTETQSSVTVTSGVFSVALGSVTAFGSSINFDLDT